MKSCVFSLLLAAAGASMFTLADSLRCYSCPEGSTGRCENIRQCSGGEETCLKLIDFNPNGKTYSKCIMYADCGSEKLAASLGLNNFQSNCCDSDLCNGVKGAGNSGPSTAARPLIGLLVGLATLYWGMN